MPTYYEGEKLKSRFRNVITDFIHKSEIIMIIDNTPTADVQEVKHGAWINEYYYGDNFYHTCDQCHTEQLVNYYDEYCAKCGSKMDGEGNKDEDY